MPFPPNIYNPYILQELYEEYINFYYLYPDFRDLYQTFDKFLKSHIKYKPNSIIYQDAMRFEGRKFHYLYR